jgi:hypothetical protein
MNDCPRQNPAYRPTQLYLPDAFCLILWVIKEEVKGDIFYYLLSYENIFLNLNILKNPIS